MSALPLRLVAGKAAAGTRDALGGPPRSADRVLGLVDGLTLQGLPDAVGGGALRAVRDLEVGFFGAGQ